MNSGGHGLLFTHVGNGVDGKCRSSFIKCTNTNVNLQIEELLEELEKERTKLSQLYAEKKVGFTIVSTHDYLFPT